MQAVELIGRAPRRFLRELKSLARVIKTSRFFSSPSRRVLAHLLQRAHLNTKIVYTYEGARFRLHDSAVSKHMFYNARRWHGTADIHFLKQLLRPGEAFVDIGANVGSHSIAIAKHFGGAVDVHAFEAHPRTFRYLQDNIQLNGLAHIKAYNTALGAEEGEVEFLDETGIDDMNRVLSRGETHPRAVRVPLRRLDDFELYRLPIGVIKIDVEGYELFVLRGAERTVAQARFLYLEASDAHYARYGYTPQDLLELLSGWGWAIYRFPEPTVIERVYPQTLHFNDDEWENWVATRSEEALLQRVALQVRGR